MQLDCSIQNYAWGKLGCTSAVASLYQSSKPGYKLDETAPYAELWMGTHPNGPSFVKSTGQLLNDYVKSEPSVLGEDSRERFGDDLPFLFKVLSVGKALSIQAHPDKAHAEQLHAERPDIYKDPNHKPEMAIALTDFEGLCGFRPLPEIQEFFRTVPQLTPVCGEANAAELLSASVADCEQAVKKCFKGLMTRDKATIERELKELKSVVDKKTNHSETDELFLRLLAAYPGDVGCFVIFFLNHLRLSPGEAMYLGANLPHAYLSGDCIECMACSDNVVRAGLTPKLIDVDTLCGMLDYTCCSDHNQLKFTPEVESRVSTLYNPPVPDFAVAHLSVPKEGGAIPKRNNASILLVTKGEGSFKVEGVAEGALTRGMVLFIPAGKEIVIETTDSEGTHCYQAFCLI